MTDRLLLAPLGVSYSRYLHICI